MNKLSYIFNSEGVILFVNNKPTKVLKTSPQYAQVVEKFDLPKDQQADAIIAVLNSNTKVVNFKTDEFEVTPEKVTYNGQELPVALANKVRSLSQEKLPLDLFKKFWENIQQNPSATSINELYSFLEYKELPLTDDGCFLAYKGLDNNYWSKMGNTKTIVNKGKVDATGHIFNGVGEVIQVDRNQVDDDRDNTCSFGLHSGSLDYARDYARGYGKMVVVKINPKDVVSVPSDYDCQKCRVCEYEVVAEFVEEIKSPAVDENNQEILSTVKQEAKQSNVNRDEFLNRLDAYLTKQFEHNFSVSVRKIQNSFSPQHPSRERVLEGVTTLGYNWYNTDKGPFVGVEEED